MITPLQAKCVMNTGAELGPCSNAYLYSDRTTFDVEPNTMYRVLGVGLLDYSLLALVFDENRDPNWYPIGLFSFPEFTFPPDWEFAIAKATRQDSDNPSKTWAALWGYPELVRDPRHSDDLMNREPAALAIFFRHLIESEEARKDDY